MDEEKITTEQAEIALAQIIDDIYLEMKAGFCDYENKTHKLGWFKERVKGEFHNFLNSPPEWFSQKNK